MRSGAVALDSAAAQTVTERYETLRTCAFGEGLPLEARSGLALFLLRGMWGWAQAVASPDMPSRSKCSCSGHSVASAQQDQAVIQLFAAMAMSFTQRRGHEQVAQSPIAPSRA